MGAQIAYAASWQIEVYRRDDALSISGGLADRELGHWLNNISIKERLESPQASAMPAIIGGFTKIIGPKIMSYRHPEGYQIVIRTSNDLVLVVLHSFEIKNAEETKIYLPEDFTYEIKDIFAEDHDSIVLEGSVLRIKFNSSFEGKCILLNKL